MRVKFLYLPAIVGVTPRVGQLASLLSDFGDFQHLHLEQYASWQPLGYPATLVLPLPGVKARQRRFVENLRNSRICGDISQAASECRQEGYEKVVCIGHGLGVGLAVATEVDYPGSLDGIIGISPEYQLARRGLPKFANLQRVRSLLILGEKDPEFQRSLKLSGEWKEYYPGAVRLEKIPGARHDFDQLLLRGGGKMRNRQFNAEQTAQADEIIKEWVTSFIS